MTMTQNRPAKKTATAAAVVTDARKAVHAARETLAEWEAKGAQARVDLAACEESAGEQILTDPSTVEQVESRLTVLRSTVRAAGRAVETQRPHVVLAESQYLSAEADALEGTAAAVRAELDEHDAKTRELLEQLEKHEGVFVLEIDTPEPRTSIDRVTIPGRKVPKSRMIRARLRIVENQVTILREMAAGRDPREWERAQPDYAIGGGVEYPACVIGPDALVPTQGYLDAVAHLRQTLADLEQLERDLPAEIEDWETGVRLSDPAYPQAGLDRRRFRQASLGDEIAAARAHLDALTASAATAAATS